MPGRSRILQYHSAALLPRGHRLRSADRTMPRLSSLRMDSSTRREHRIIMAATNSSSNNNNIIIKINNNRGSGGTRDGAGKTVGSRQVLFKRQGVMLVSLSF